MNSANTHHDTGTTNSVSVANNKLNKHMTHSISCVNTLANRQPSSSPRTSQTHYRQNASGVVYSRYHQQQQYEHHNQNPTNNRDTTNTKQLPMAQYTAASSGAGRQSATNGIKMIPSSQHHNHHQHDIRTGSPPQSATSSSSHKHAAHTTNMMQQLLGGKRHSSKPGTVSAQDYQQLLMMKQTSSGSSVSTPHHQHNNHQHNQHNQINMLNTINGTTNKCMDTHSTPQSTSTKPPPSSSNTKATPAGQNQNNTLAAQTLLQYARTIDTTSASQAHANLQSGSHHSMGQQQVTNKLSANNVNQHNSMSNGANGGLTHHQSLSHIRTQATLGLKESRRATTSGSNLVSQSSSGATVQQQQHFSSKHQLSKQMQHQTSSQRQPESSAISTSTIADSQASSNILSQKNTAHRLSQQVISNSSSAIAANQSATMTINSKNNRLLAHKTSLNDFKKPVSLTSNPITSSSTKNTGMISMIQPTTTSATTSSMTPTSSSQIVSAHAYQPQSQANPNASSAQHHHMSSLLTKQKPPISSGPISNQNESNQVLVGTTVSKQNVGTKHGHSNSSPPRNHQLNVFTKKKQSVDVTGKHPATTSSTSYQLLSTTSNMHQSKPNTNTAKHSFSHTSVTPAALPFSPPTKDDLSHQQAALMSKRRELVKSHVANASAIGQSSQNLSQNRHLHNGGQSQTPQSTSTMTLKSQVNSLHASRTAAEKKLAQDQLSTSTALKSRNLLSKGTMGGSHAQIHSQKDSSNQNSLVLKGARSSGGFLDQSNSNHQQKHHQQNSHVHNHQFHPPPPTHHTQFSSNRNNHATLDIDNSTKSATKHPTTSTIAYRHSKKQTLGQKEHQQQQIDENQHHQQHLYPQSTKHSTGQSNATLGRSSSVQMNATTSTSGHYSYSLTAAVSKEGIGKQNSTNKGMNGHHHQQLLRGAAQHSSSNSSTRAPTASSSGAHMPVTALDRFKDRHPKLHQSTSQAAQKTADSAFYAHQQNKERSGSTSTAAIMNNAYKQHQMTSGGQTSTSSAINPNNNTLSQESTAQNPHEVSKTATSTANGNVSGHITTSSQLYAANNNSSQVNNNASQQSHTLVHQQQNVNANSTSVIKPANNFATQLSQKMAQNRVPKIAAEQQNKKESNQQREQQHESRRQEQHSNKNMPPQSCKPSNQAMFQRKVRSATRASELDQQTLHDNNHHRQHQQAKDNGSVKTANEQQQSNSTTTFALGRLAAQQQSTNQSNLHRISHQKITDRPQSASAGQKFIGRQQNLKELFERNWQSVNIQNKVDPQSGEATQIRSLTVVDTNCMVHEEQQEAAALPLAPGTRIIIPNHEPTKCSNKRNGIVRAYAANTNQGLVRNYNEDRVSIILNIVKPEHRKHETWPTCSFFGVYDGHGGSACAEYLRDNLHHYVIKEENFPWQPEEAIRKGFEKAEARFLEMCQAKDETTGQMTVIERSGSCAIVVLIVGEICYIANVGDSRAVLSSNAGQQMTALSRDHKPSDIEEYKRIIQAGGQIYQTTTSQTLPNNNGANATTQQAQQQQTKVPSTDKSADPEFIVGPIRVLPGRLSVCRTFGDPEAKLEYRGGNPNVVKAVPDIRTFQIAKQHDFIVLASDGIYDKLSDDDIGKAVWLTCETAKQAKSTQSASATQQQQDQQKQQQQNISVHQYCGLGVEGILKNSLMRQSLDNVTVVMVAFANFKRIACGHTRTNSAVEIRQPTHSNPSSSAHHPHHYNSGSKTRQHQQHAEPHTQAPASSQLNSQVDQTTPEQQPSPAQKPQPPPGLETKENSNVMSNHNLKQHKTISGNIASRSQQQLQHHHQHNVPRSSAITSTIGSAISNSERGTNNHHTSENHTNLHQRGLKRHSTEANGVQFTNNQAANTSNTVQTNQSSFQLKRASRQHNHHHNQQPHHEGQQQQNQQAHSNSGHRTRSQQQAASQQQSFSGGYQQYSIHRQQQQNNQSTTTATTSNGKMGMPPSGAMHNNMNMNMMQRSLSTKQDLMHHAAATTSTHI